MIRHLVGALKTERLGRGGAGHAQFLDDRLILPPPQELVINHDLPTSSTTLVRVGMIRNGKLYLLFIGSCGSIDPSRPEASGPRIRR